MSYWKGESAIAYQTVAETTGAFRDYDAAIESIPESFTVHNDYCIDGMQADDLTQGYKAYHGLIRHLNAEIIAYPEQFGLTAAAKKGGKLVCFLHYPYIWLFVALTRSGDIKNGVLFVKGKQFAK